MWLEPETDESWRGDLHWDWPWEYAGPEYRLNMIYPHCWSLKKAR